MREGEGESGFGDDGRVSRALVRSARAEVTVAGMNGACCQKMACVKFARSDIFTCEELIDRQMTGIRRQIGKNCGAQIFVQVQTLNKIGADRPTLP